jgi:hypothetical protein
MAEVVSIKTPSQPASTRGRPPFRPTLTQRDRVEIMAAAGLSHRDISTAMQISRKRRGAGLIDGCDQARLARYAANLLRWPVSNDRQFHGSRS